MKTKSKKTVSKKATPTPEQRGLAKAEDGTYYDPNRIYFFHVRKWDKYGNLKNHCGYTVAAMISDLGIYYTKAKCSKKDNFCRKIGRQVAEGRLLKGKETKFYPSYSVVRFSRFVYGKETPDENLKTEGHSPF